MKSRKATGPGFVYLFSLGEFHKIGSSGNPAKRAISYATLPYPFALVCQFPSAAPYLIERALHRRFHAQRVRGEWFRLSAEDVAAIRGVQSADAVADLPSGLTPAPQTSRRRVGKNLNVWVREPAASLVDRCLAESQGALTLTALMEDVIRSYLQEKGYWPPPA